MTSWLDPEGTELAVLSRAVDLDGVRLLEIGAGRGRLLRLCAERAAFAVGLDPDPVRLEEAEPEDGACDFTLVRGSGLALPFADDVFDVALFGWSL